jgi:uncharacterized protein (TIGR03437 family)
MRIFKMRPHKRLINRITITALAILPLITFIVVSHLAGSTGIVGNNVVAAQSPVTVVNAVTYTSPVGLGSFAAAFGTNLAVRTETAATVNPPVTQIAGTTLRLVSGGVDVQAQLFFVSDTQVNFLVPNIPLGMAQVIVTNANGVVSTGTVQVVQAAPAMYTTAQGVPIGFTVDYIYYSPIANPDGSPIQINPGTFGRQLLLGIQGTGFNSAGSVVVRFGSVDVPASYFGPGNLNPAVSQINVPIPPNVPRGLINVTVIADGQFSSNTMQLLIGGGSTGSPNLLSLNDVTTIISQCVQSAKQQGLAGTCAVVDREGNVLAVFAMNGANPLVRITGGKPIDQGLEGVMVPSMLAAISKAGTAAFFSTQGSAINTRTASFIIQENFQPGQPNAEAGPLFGVQFSQLPCSDVRPANGTLPLGLSGDLGSASVYKFGPNGPIAVGGSSFEANGTYTIDLNIVDVDDNREELVAVASTFGFNTPANLRIDNVRVNGVTLPYVNYPQTGGPAPPVTAADGQFLLGPIAQPASRYVQTVIGGIPVKFDRRFFPPRDSIVPAPNQGGLSAGDVLNILTNAVQGAYKMRAAIRTLSPDQVEINSTVVDTGGNVLGILSTTDAPEFGFDVSAQKARTANLFSNPNAQALLLAAGAAVNTPLNLGPGITSNPGANIISHVNAANAFGFPLNGSIVFSSRGMGFAARPFFPDGQNGSNITTPFSRPINVFSPFNDGLQLQLVLNDLVAALGGDPSVPCTAVPLTPNGIQIFAGSSALFRGGQMLGAVGISGDGIDQDDTVSGAGALGLEAPQNLDSTNLVIQGVRFPYLRFPPFPCIFPDCRIVLP